MTTQPDYIINPISKPTGGWAYQVIRTCDGATAYFDTHEAAYNWR